MKKTVKRLLVLLLAVSMTMVAPVRADAKTITDTTQVAILYPKSSPTYGDKQLVQYTKKVKVQSVKSSKKSVAAVSVGKDSGSKEYAIYVVPKKTGTTTVTYKLGKDKHKLKVIVRKYVNPFKKITINGKNITSKFNKTNVCNLSYKQYKGKKVTITYKKKGNWKILHADYFTKSDKLIKCHGTILPGDKETIKITKKNSKLYFWIPDTMDKYEPAEECTILFK